MILTCHKCGREFETFSLRKARFCPPCRRERDTMRDTEYYRAHKGKINASRAERKEYVYCSREWCPYLPRRGCFGTGNHPSAMPTVPGRATRAGPCLHASRSEGIRNAKRVGVGGQDEILLIQGWRTGQVGRGIRGESVGTDKEYFNEHILPMRRGTGIHGQTGPLRRNPKGSVEGYRRH